MTDNFPLIDFTAAAKRIIAEWSGMDEDEREEVPAFQVSDEYGPVPFTVYDDWSVCLGNYTDGICSGGSATSADDLAATILQCAALLDYDHTEMTTPLVIR
jgi:hypothetical protein